MRRRLASKVPSKEAPCVSKLTRDCGARGRGADWWAVSGGLGRGCALVGRDRMRTERLLWEKADVREENDCRPSLSGEPSRRRLLVASTRSLRDGRRPGDLGMPNLGEHEEWNEGTVCSVSISSKTSSKNGSMAAKVEAGARMEEDDSVADFLGPATFRPALLLRRRPVATLERGTYTSFVSSGMQSGMETCKVFWCRASPWLGGATNDRIPT